MHVIKEEVEVGHLAQGAYWKTVDLGVLSAYRTLISRQSYTYKHLCHLNH